MASEPAARTESFAVFIPELERLITEVMDEWKVPGLAVAVVQNGEGAFARPYGLRDVEAGLKVTTNTQFQLMSVSKSFAATGLALLVDERRMDWKKPVREYIAEFRLHDAIASDRVTVRDLLCHHSGLPRHDWIWLPGDLLPAQMLAALRYLEPLVKDIAFTRIGAGDDRLGGLAYSFVLAHDFARALEASDQAIALAPNKTWLYTNRAHALMFLGRIDEARALYQQYRGAKNVWRGKSWETAILEDFAVLRVAGLTQPLMDEIEKRFAAGG